MAEKTSLFEQIKSPSVESLLDEFIISSSTGGRDFLVTSDTARKDGHVKRDEWEDYCKLIYTRWYNHLKNLQPEDAEKILDGKYKKTIDYVRENIKASPEIIAKNKTFVDFLTDHGDKFGGLSPFIDQDGAFFHIMPLPGEKPRQPTECRLYLNISSKYITSVTKSLMEKADKQKAPLYFKTARSTGASDVVVIYTQYRNMNAIVDILKEIKNEKPEWFVGAEKTAKSEGQIAGFIGFGEEPNKAIDCEGRKGDANSVMASGLSYNGERGAVLERLRYDYIMDNARQVMAPGFTTPNLKRGAQNINIIQYLMHEYKEMISQNYDIDVKDHDNQIALRALAIETLRMINGGERSFVGTEFKDKNGKKFNFKGKDLTPQLMKLYGCSKQELLGKIFNDSNQNPGYKDYCFDSVKQGLIVEINKRIKSATNGFCKGMNSTQIPVSDYQDILKSVQQGSEAGNSIINRAVYNHIIDLYKDLATLHNHKTNPQKYAKPDRATTGIGVSFDEKSNMQGYRIYDFTGKMLNGYMKQNDIKPIMPSEAKMREECLKNDVSYDNFCFNESTWQKYQKHKNKSTDNKNVKYITDSSVYETRYNEANGMYTVVKNGNKVYEGKDVSVVKIGAGTNLRFGNRTSGAIEQAIPLQSAGKNCQNNGLKVN